MVPAADLAMRASSAKPPRQAVRRRPLCRACSWLSLVGLARPKVEAAFQPVNISRAPVVTQFENLGDADRVGDGIGGRFWHCGCLGIRASTLHDAKHIH